MTKLSRRQFLKFAAGAALLGAGGTLLGGCSHRQRFEEGKLVLDFFNYASLEFIKLYETKLIPAFEKKHPKIKIRMITNLGDTGYDAKLLTMIVGKIAPDIFHVTQKNYPFYANKKLILPLDNFIENDDTVRRGHFYEKLLQGMTTAGELLGLPSDFSPIVMFYNRDIFDKYGVKYPDLNWTWDDYLEKCKALTRDTDNDGIIDLWGTRNVDAYNRWPAWVWGNGGDIFTPDMKRCVMDTPESIGGLRFYVDLSRTEKVSPLPSDSMGQGDEDMFVARNAAIIADSRYAYKKFLGGKGLSFKWDLAPMPKGRELATTFIWGGNCIFRDTPYPEESWEFLKFLSGEVGAAINLEAGNGLPAYREATEHAVRERIVPNAPLRDTLFLDAIEYGRQAPFPPQFAEFSTAMQGLSDAYLGLVTVEEACKRFAREVNETLSSRVF
jgi:multiple sugar transport system substrate-binding protein